MYQFSEEARKALEQSALPLACFQNVEDGNTPILVSDGYCNILGLSREELLAEQKWGKFVRIHPDDAGRITQALSLFWEKKGNYDVLYRVKCADDAYHYIHSVAFWWPMEDGTELILAIYLDLHKWTNEVKQLADSYEVFKRDQFYMDALTGLPNINYLNQFAQERADLIREQGGDPVLVYTDTHSMQYYNSHYGFTRGNEMLCIIAEELKAAFPEGLVMRGADDHFIVIDTYPGAEELTDRIEAANENVRKRAYGNTSGIQAGVSLFDDEMTISEAVDHARQAVKLIRDDLNRTVKFFSHADDESYWSQRYIIENFDRALSEGWIKIYYQCISRVETNKGSALEALARWIDPARGIISPGEFIPVLRRYHLLYKLDLYIVEQVCKEISLRADAGFMLMPVSVNFAAQDFDYVDIPAEIDALYERYGCGRYVDKKFFVIEITEQDVATATGRFHEQLQTLRKNGHRLWLDDFGSGYSSLNMFSRFEFDLIKFDMDLLRHLDENNGANRVILEAMIGVARELGIHTLAEGMETEEQRQFLRESGCELAQGYLFHKPESLDAMLYRRRNGQKGRPCETPEEREEKIRAWSKR